MELFFPEASRAIDFKRLKFLQQEIFTDVTAGEKRKVDLLVETKLKDEPGIILIHVEPQSYIQQEFNQRMFIYFSRLHEKYQRRILPIAIFSYEQVRDEADSFEISFPFLDVLKFNFYKLELKKLNWRDYINSNNPVAAALLSKMGFKTEEKVKVKVEFMRMLARMQIDPARTELLGGFFETYLKLSIQEEQKFNRELDKMSKKEADAIMQITTSWHEKGKLEGKLEGKIEDRQQYIEKFLVKRFGMDDSKIKEKVKQLTDLEVLDNVLAELFTVNSVEEAEIIIRKASGN